MGTGSLKKGEGRRVAAGWVRIADQHRVIVRPKGKAEYGAHMAALGIGVKRVKKVTPDG